MTKDEALDKKADNAMIYKTFEQWVNGDFLEVGEPRKKAYSKDELLLVEMGWNYGYDAGRAVEQALDKKAENARELGLMPFYGGDYEPVQPRCKVGGMPTPGHMCPMIIVGGKLCGDKGFCPHQDTTPPNVATPLAAQEEVQRLSALVRAQQITIDKLEEQWKWTGLSEEELQKILQEVLGQGWKPMLEAIEAKLKEKNNG